ncbi:MAG: hypothetical protein IJE78_00570 [Bacteroidaceae bacterium]|nr:hypothetical protein [Bacteroidaceae bacterium]MBQ2855607.1 hypothetical protein [Bacteroidaceae bacterium]
MEENKLNLIVEITEEALKKELDGYVWKEQCAYEVKKHNLDEYVTLSIIPKDLSCPFITCSAINDVQKVCALSEWKDKIFYGIDTQIVYDKESEEHKIIPSLTVFIQK